MLFLFDSLTDHFIPLRFYFLFLNRRGASAVKKQLTQHKRGKQIETIDDVN